MDAVKVIAPGGYTTIQDKGRIGFQDMGVPVSGALDGFSAACANILAGSPENAPVLELTVMGPSLEVMREMDIALTGAQMDITINNIPMAQWQSLRVRPGDMIRIGQVQAGCRAYLAVNGGFDVPRIMGSASTYAGAKIGGIQGRPLVKDDILKKKDAPLLKKERVFPPKYIPEHESEVTVRAVPGPQDDYFDQGIDTLFNTSYMVTPKADRMGYRLMGDKISIKDGMPKSIVSEPSVPGSIQIPPDEQPIILMVEQTVGGYAKIATVISSDLPKVAQTTPGDTIRFEQINIHDAHTLFMENQTLLTRIRGMFSKT